MKHHLLTIATSFLAASNLIAQNDLYCRFDIGAGLSNIIQKNYLFTNDTRSLFAYNAGLSLGKKTKNLHFVIGVGYTHTGFAIKNLAFNNSSTGAIDIASFTYSYDHLLLSLGAKKDIKLNRLTITPSLGMAVCYNFKHTAKIASTVYGKHSQTDRFSGFDSLYKRTSIFGIISLEIALPINDGISLIIAPTYYHMLTSILKQSNYAMFQVMNSKQYNYAYILNFGMQFWLNSNKESLNIKKTYETN